MKSKRWNKKGFELNFQPNCWQLGVAISCDKDWFYLACAIGPLQLSWDKK